ncbi:MAG: hypothetical protein RI932_2212 [Pseudomonadota bacterium]|jgi:uncharacterized protein YbjT (DUF2867 family)
MSESSSPVLRIAIAGASGFVGTDLARRLSHTHQIIALTRSTQASDTLPQHRNPGVYWVCCNLFSLRETENALAGSDIAFFLVHSMMPSARLTQGDYDDLDLMIADNFSRAAATAEIRRIIYLGGIQPENGYVSRHLRSRLEVEEVLRSRAPECVALRAGLILGPGGSSSLILVRLIQRLPVMLCPPWTSKKSSPIALRDTVNALVDCLNSEKVSPGAFDLQGPEQVSYLQLMRRSADEMNLRRFFIKIPMFSVGLSRLWVSLITRQSRELVAPLIQSLLVDMVPGRSAPVFPLERTPLPLIQALHQAEMPKVRLEISGQTMIPNIASPSADTVVSIQRLPLPSGWDALDVAKEYTQWLPRIMRPFIRLDLSSDGTRLRFKLIGLRAPLLELEFIESRSDARRALFLVVGGLLRAVNSRPLSRLEFRVFPEQRLVLAAVLDFSPALPWLIYLVSQAQAHQLIMLLFSKHLGRLSRKI